MTVKIVMTCTLCGASITGKLPEVVAWDRTHKALCEGREEVPIPPLAVGDTVATVAELEALPVGTVLVDPDEDELVHLAGSRWVWPNIEGAQDVITGLRRGTPVAHLVQHGPFIVKELPSA